MVASALDIMLDALPSLTEDLSTTVEDGTGLSVGDTSLVPRDWATPVLSKDLPAPPEQGRGTRALSTSTRV